MNQCEENAEKYIQEQKCRAQERLTSIGNCTHEQPEIARIVYSSNKKVIYSVSHCICGQEMWVTHRKS